MKLCARLVVANIAVGRNSGQRSHCQRNAPAVFGSITCDIEWMPLSLKEQHRDRFEVMLRGACTPPLLATAIDVDLVIVHA